MMTPMLLSGGGGKADPALAGRVTAAETDIATLKSGKATTQSVTAVRDRVEILENRAVVDQTARDAASAAQNTANSRATTASVKAVSDRVTTLEQSGGSGGGSSAPAVPFLVGVYEITSGTSFNRGALLAASFMTGVVQRNCRIDLYLVGGGQGGWTRSSTSSSFQSPGGRPGNVRIARGLSFDDLVDGTPLAVGAGSLARTSGAFSGGDTVFGAYRARGGQAQSNVEAFEDMDSDVRLGRPGSVGIINQPGSISAQIGLNARVSLGPGAGGGASGTLFGYGGPSNPDNAAIARVTPTANGAAGVSAAAGTLAYGSGGGGGNGSTGGNGGFPGGGGGSTCGGTELAAGNGGNGVIRFAVYEYRVAA